MTQKQTPIPLDDANSDAVLDFINSLEGTHAYNAYDDILVKDRFLEDYSDTPNNYRIYRREVERFLLWFWLEKGISLESVENRHVREYKSFLKAVPLSWCSYHSLRRIQPNGEPNPDWRPFQCQDGCKRGHTLSPSSIKTARVALNAFLYFYRDGLDRYKRQDYAMLGSYIPQPHPKRSWDFVYSCCKQRVKEKPKFKLYRQLVIVGLLRAGATIKEIDECNQGIYLNYEMWIDSRSNTMTIHPDPDKPTRVITLDREMVEYIQRMHEEIGIGASFLRDYPYILTPHSTGDSSLKVRQLKNVATEALEYAMIQRQLSGKERSSSRILERCRGWLVNPLLVDAEPVRDQNDTKTRAIA